MTNFLTARWENLLIANYEVDKEVLIPYLPAGTELDFFHGKTYVSLVAFLFAKTRILGLPLPVMHTFEEVNLRFYVTRKEDGEIKRGVVFIQEVVPHKPVAFLANTLFHEKYITLKMSHSHSFSAEEKVIGYRWKVKNRWNHFELKTNAEELEVAIGSEEEFILEHYFGYTSLSEHKSQEYNVAHKRWTTHQVKHVDISCDFNAQYGRQFAFLNAVKPASVMASNGVDVAIKWKRNTFSEK